MFVEGFLANKYSENLFKNSRLDFTQPNISIKEEIGKLLKHDNSKECALCAVIQKYGI